MPGRPARYDTTGHVAWSQYTADDRDRCRRHFVGNCGDHACRVDRQSDAAKLAKKVSKRCVTCDGFVADDNQYVFACGFACREEYFVSIGTGSVRDSKAFFNSKEEVVRDPYFEIVFGPPHGSWPGWEDEKGNDD